MEIKGNVLNLHIAPNQSVITDEENSTTFLPNEIWIEIDGDSLRLVDVVEVYRGAMIQLNLK